MSSILNNQTYGSIALIQLVEHIDIDVVLPTNKIGGLETQDLTNFLTRLAPISHRVAR